MSNKFEILNNATIDGDSAIFKVNQRNALGVNDTQYSAYFEIQGVLDGAVLSWQKECQAVGAGAATFLEIEDDTLRIKDNFPAAGKCYILPLGIKFDDRMKFVISNAGASTDITVTGINISAA